MDERGLDGTPPRTARVALLGFLPWTDGARGIAVSQNPAALASERAARALSDGGLAARHFGVPVSGEGIREVMAEIAALDPGVCVALGQTRSSPRVERQGRVPGAWSSLDAAAGPFALLGDAEALATHLSTLVDPAAETGPTLVSEDPGGYFCDHLCVELAIDARARRSRAAFLHVPPIDGCTPQVREARLAQYARQAAAAARWLLEDLVP